MNYIDLPKLNITNQVVVEKRTEHPKNQDSHIPDPHPIGYAYFGTPSSTATGPSQQTVSITYIPFEGANPYQENQYLASKSLSELIINPSEKKS